MTAPTLVSSSTPQTNASNTLAVTMPASPVVGNHVFVEIAHGGASMQTPSGWTQEFAAQNNTALFWHKIDGTESWFSGGGTVTFQTGTVSAITQAVAKQIHGALESGSPVDTWVTGGNTATANSPTLTPSNTSVNDTYNVFTDFKNASRTLTGSPTGMTLRQGTTTGQLHSFDKAQSVAGSPGSLTATFSGGGSTHSTMFYALKPAVPKTGSGTASFSITSTETGKRVPKGSGTATFSETSTSTGKRVPKGSGTASFSLAGAGSGTRESAGSGSASFSISSQGGGYSDDPQGSGVADLHMTSSGTGKRTPKGSGSAALSIVSTGTGKRVPKGSGVAAFSISASGSGQTPRRGQGSASFTMTSTAHGKAVGRRNIIVSGGNLRGSTFRGTSKLTPLTGTLEAP